MSAVITASSARVRDASAWPTLASNSALLSRPCTNAALSALIACSRSTGDARRRRGGTACSSPGPVVTSASSPIRHKERNPAAVGDHPAGRGRDFDLAAARRKLAPTGQEPGPAWSGQKETRHEHDG